MSRGRYADRAQRFAEQERSVRRIERAIRDARDVLAECDRTDEQTAALVEGGLATEEVAAMLRKATNDRRLIAAATLSVHGSGS
jgi:hypothetical protein